MISSMPNRTPDAPSFPRRREPGGVHGKSPGSRLRGNDGGIEGAVTQFGKFSQER